MKRAVIFFLLITFSYITTIHARNPQNSFVFFNTLVDSAYKNNYIIKSFENYVHSVQKNINITSSLFFPKIDFNYTFTGTTEPGQAAFLKAKQGKFSMNYYFNHMTNPPFVKSHTILISIMQPIFAKGKISLSKKEAQLNFKAAQDSLSEIKREIKFKIFSTLIGANKLFDNIDIAENMSRKAKTYLTTVENLYKNGISLKSDYLYAKFHLKKAEIFKNTLLNDLDKIRHALKQLTGKNYKIKKLDFMVKDNLVINDIIQYGLTHREDIAVTKKYIKIAEIELKKKRNEYLPEIYGFADYERNSETLHETDKGGYTVGAGIRLNIFNGMKNKNEIAKAKFALLRLKNILKNKEETLKREIKNSFVDFKNAKYEYDSLKELVESNKIALQLSENRFKQGLERITTLVEMETNYKNSLKELSTAKWDMVLKYYTILFKAGKF